MCNPKESFDPQDFGINPYMQPWSHYFGRATGGDGLLGSAGAINGVLAYAQGLASTQFKDAYRRFQDGHSDER